MTPHFVRHGIAPLSDEEHRLRAELRLDAAAIVERDGQAVGVIKPPQDGTTWKIEQFQIARAHQGACHGATVLRTLAESANSHQTACIDTGAPPAR
jgi:hypothetical protein